MSLAFRGVEEELRDVIAAEHGRSIENLYLEWVGAVSRHRPEQPSDAAVHSDLGEYDPNEDPLADLLGAFQSGIPDLGRRHDEYLGQSHLKPHDSQH